MDTITHGIAGALIGKAFFGGEDLFTRQPLTQRRVAAMAATLGAIFPDVDIVRDVVSRDPMTLLMWHRSWTHSVVMLPVFALGLAALTRYIARKRAISSPSFALLLLIYAVGIGSHIFLDYATSFCTMLLTPLSVLRTVGVCLVYLLVIFSLLFCVFCFAHFSFWRLLVALFSLARGSFAFLFFFDFSLTAFVLVPQFVAALYRAREGFPRRALRMWLGFSACAGLAAWLLTAAEFPPSLAAMFAVLCILAVLFFAPAAGGWGYRVSFKNWNRTGFVVFAAYMGLAAWAHQAAMTRIEKFAEEKRLPVETLGALPLPPSVLHWDGLARTPRGVSEIRMNLSDRVPPGPQDRIGYSHYPDPPPNDFLAR